MLGSVPLLSPPLSLLLVVEVVVLVVESRICRNQGNEIPSRGGGLGRRWV